MTHIKNLIGLGATLIAGAILLLILFQMMTGYASASCSDPFTQNEPQVYRSLSGVEVDWSFTVASGCTVDVTVQARRDVGSSDDIRTAVHRQTGPISLTSAGGQHVLNVLVTTSEKVHAILLNDGRVYRIIDIDPTTIP